MKDYELAARIKQCIGQGPTQRVDLHNRLEDAGVVLTPEKMWLIQDTIDDMVCKGELIAVYYSAGGPIKCSELYFSGHMHVGMSDEEFRKVRHN